MRGHNDTRSITGFRSFWEKTKREAATRQVTFVQVDVGGESKKSKGVQSDGTDTLGSERGQSEETQATAEGNRRHQVYQAQKRHRQRKAEYAQTLETELAQLQHIELLHKLETQQLAQQNTAIKKCLTSNGLAHEVDAVTLESSPRHLSNAGLDLVVVTSPTEFTAELRSQDLSSQIKIERCRTLLLKDIQRYDDDEEQTWKMVAGVVGHEQQCNRRAMRAETGSTVAS